MLRKSISTLALLIVPGVLYACQLPNNIFGINFTNGESFDPVAIETLGEMGVSYIKTQGPSGACYSFRNHYDPNIMVKLSSEGLLFAVDLETFPLSEFPFDRCIRAELDWLVETGVMSIDRVKRERIEALFQKYPSEFVEKGYENECCFYWTKEDTIIQNVFRLFPDGTFAPGAEDCKEPDMEVLLPPEKLDSHTDIKKLNKAVQLPRMSGVSDNMISVDISGRKFIKKADMSMVKPSGVMLQYNRSSGIIKRTVSLP